VTDRQQGDKESLISEVPHLSSSQLLPESGGKKPQVFPRWLQASCLILLVLAVTVIYGQTLWFDFVPYDDPAIITGNGYVAPGLTWKGIVWAFTYRDGNAELAHDGVENLWHPLTWLSHMLDAQIFGIEQAGGHHFTNVLLHTLNAFLVCIFVRELTRSGLAGLVAALLFVVHPLRVESVAWVSERKDVLSGLFFFLSLIFVMRGNRTVAFAAYIAAMMGKPSTVVLPVIAMLALGWRDGERSWALKFWWDRVVEWRWWLGAGAAVALTTIFFQGKGTHAELMGNLPTELRLLTLGTGLLFFIWRSIVPWDLTFHYAYPPAVPLIHLLAWAIVGVLLLTVWLYRKSHPNVFFTAVWFLVCLLPSSGIVYVGTSFTADRYTYLALTGGFAMIGLWTAQEGKFRGVRFGVVGLTMVVMTLLSIKQCATWRNGWTLFAHAVEVQPRNTVPLGNLGGMYQQAGNHQEAMTLYRRVLGLYPSDAMAWFNLGNSLRDTGDAAGAVEAFRKSSESRPGFSNAWRNLGLMLGSSDPMVADPLGARKAFQQAVTASNRRDPIAILLLAEAEFQLGQTEQAAELLKALEKFQPTDPKVMKHLSKLRDQVKNRPTSGSTE